MLCNRMSETGSLQIPFSYSDTVSDKIQLYTQQQVYSSYTHCVPCHYTTSQQTYTFAAPDVILLIHIIRPSWAACACVHVCVCVCVCVHVHIVYVCAHVLSVHVCACTYVYSCWIHIVCRLNNSRSEVTTTTPPCCTHPLELSRTALRRSSPPLSSSSSP